MKHKYGLKIRHYREDDVLCDVAYGDLELVDSILLKECNTHIKWREHHWGEMAHAWVKPKLTNEDTVDMTMQLDFDIERQVCNRTNKIIL